MTEKDNPLLEQTEIDDELLEQFFDEARRHEVADNGFTQQVISRLPDRAIRQSHWWTASCVLLGLVLFVVCKGWQPVVIGLYYMVHSLLTEVHVLPLLISMGVTTCLAVLALARRFERMLA